MDIDFTPLRIGDEERCLLATSSICKESKNNPELMFRMITLELIQSDSIRYSARLLRLLRSMDKETLENSLVLKRHFKNLGADSASRYDVIRFYLRILSRCGQDM